MKKKPIIDPRGQWAYPGENTMVPTPTGQITMQGVPYPVYGQDETGYGQMMYPGGEYQFPGQMVYEIPMMQKGGSKIKDTAESSLAVSSLALPFPANYVAGIAGSAIDFYDAYNADTKEKRNQQLAEAILGLIPYGRVVKGMKIGDDAYRAYKALKPFAMMNKAVDVKDTVDPNFASGGQHGGLDRWFAEKWVDVKTGKDCGRQEGEKRKGYPACRPSRRVSEDTPKTSSELSSAEREKFKRSKTSSERINYQHRRKEDGGETNNSDMANKPNNPSLWSRAKSLARQKFDVYPSAYANGWAAKWYKGKGGTWRKAEYGMEVPYMEDGGKPEWLVEAQLKAQGYSGNALQQKISSMAQEGGEPQTKVPYFSKGVPASADATYVSRMTPRNILPPQFFVEGVHPNQVTSLVDFLDYAGLNTDKKYRAKAAKFMGIDNYDYSAKKNTELLKSLQKYGTVIEGMDRAIKAGDDSQYMHNGNIMVVNKEGGQMPPALARARFAAAGNLDKMADYGYAYGGYIPEMMYGGYDYMDEGGEPNGEMALGQMAAVSDKMAKLLQFVKPEDNLDPWIASKLAVMDHSADAISDYMMYGAEGDEEETEEDDEMGEQEMEEMRDGGGIPQRYKNMGFNKVGVKKNSTRPGKKWMVLAKKGDQYKVVHGGYDGMKDFSQHGSEQRKENFWNRMGGKNSSKATDPFSPLYWHKKFRTWEEGGEIYEMQDGGTFNQAFAAARKDGKKIFTWNGKSYTTQLAEETNQEKPRSMIQNNTAKPPVRKATPVKPVVKRASSLPQDREVVNDPRNIFQKLFNMNEDEIRRFNLPVDVYDAYQKQREDNKGKNFGIVSKKNARAYFFDDDGNLAVQDEVGFGKDRGEDQPVYYKVMTTPSGTYRMERPKFAAPVADKMRKGYAAKNFFYMDNTDESKKLIDAPGSSRGVTPRQAMHGIPTHLLDKRSKAFGNKTVDDNYMSAGCINCKRPFLDNPYFDSFQDGLVYVLPEKKKGGSTFSGNAWYNMGGGMPCYECGGMFAYGGYLPEPVYQQGGPAIGEELDVTPEQLEMLRQQGYKFEII
jgi:hypothetical protein